jgi:hypothetical protein
MGARRRWVIGSITGLLAVTAIAHTPVGLRAMAWVTGSDGCPFGGAKQPLTASRAEQLRVAKLDRGTQPAPAKPARGFVLDVERRADIEAWIAKQQLSCVADKSGAGIRCEHVDAIKLPVPIQDLEAVVSFGFDDANRLVSLQLQSATATPKARVLEVAGSAMSVLEGLGGTAKGDELAAPKFVHRTAKVAFSNYTASVIASNVGSHVMMSESYQSIPSNAVASR